METNVLLLSAAGASVAVAALLVVYALSAQPDRARAQTMTNLQRGARRTSGETELISGGGLVGLARKFTPSGRVRGLDAQLAKAGRPAAWPLERVLVTKVLGTAIAAAFMLIIVGFSPSVRMFALAVAVVVFVWFLPEILLYNTAQKRRTSIQLALPDTLDQMSIAVEAGLGFESAMAHVARNGTGPLAEELVRTLQDIQVGQVRRDAYRALAERSPEPDLRRFLRAIVQAEQHGVSVARVLTTQAQEMRIKRRQRAEEKAMRIPVKVVFPLMLTILPVLFIVIMGPAVINILATFSGQ